MLDMYGRDVTQNFTVYFSDSDHFNSCIKIEAHTCKVIILYNETKNENCILNINVDVLPHDVRKFNDSINCGMNISECHKVDIYEIYYKDKFLLSGILEHPFYMDSNHTLPYNISLEKECSYDKLKSIIDDMNNPIANKKVSKNKIKINKDENSDKDNEDLLMKQLKDILDHLEDNYMLSEYDDGYESVMNWFVNLDNDNQKYIIQYLLNHTRKCNYMLDIIVNYNMAKEKKNE